MPGSELGLLSSFDHDDVISKLSLDLDKLGASRGACLKCISRLLKLGIQTALGLPSKRTTLSGLIFRELARNLVKLDALVELCQSFLLLGVLLTL